MLSARCTHGFPTHDTLPGLESAFHARIPDLLNLFEANALAAEQEEKQRQTMPDYHADPIAILFIRSDLRLVVDSQNCIKAQQSRAYAQKVKISNLQQMAKTVAYIQENGFDTRENLQTTYDSITLQMHDARQKTKDTETQIKSVNEQIHYPGISTTRSTRHFSVSP